jgi:glycosyltransferase involved in cell wall biosynthesis
MILPVRDRETTISAIFAQIVETLPELTPRWNLLVVDDGSTDATPEVLQELIRPYPQVALVHHSAPRGETACFRAGTRRTRADLLLLRAEDCELDVAGIDAMWKQATSHDLVVARPAADISPVRRGTLQLRRKTTSVVARPALLLVRRRIIREWMADTDEHDLQAYLGRKGHPRHEIELRIASHLPFRPGNATTSRPRPDGTMMRPQHCDNGQAIGQPKRPNYLLRLKEFALGE